MKSSKTILVSAIMIALFSITMIGGCKKQSKTTCYTCVHQQPCAYCHDNSIGTNSGTYCKATNANDYNQANAECSAIGGTWVMSSTTPSTTEFCSKSNTEINSAQITCQSDSGVWASK